MDNFDDNNKDSLISEEFLQWVEAKKDRSFIKFNEISEINLGNFKEDLRKIMSAGFKVFVQKYEGPILASNLESIETMSAHLPDSSIDEVNMDLTTFMVERDVFEKKWQQKKEEFWAKRGVKIKH